MTVLNQEQAVIRVEQQWWRPGEAGKRAHPQCAMGCPQAPCGIFSGISLLTNALNSQFSFGGTVNTDYNCRSAAGNLEGPQPHWLMGTYPVSGVLLDQHHRIINSGAVGDSVYWVDYYPHEIVPFVSFLFVHI